MSAPPPPSAAGGRFPKAGRPAARAGGRLPLSHLDPVAILTSPGIPNELVLSTSCFGSRLKTIEDQAFAAVAMGFRKIEFGLSELPVDLAAFEDTQHETGLQVTSLVAGCQKPYTPRMASMLLGSYDPDEREQALNSVRRHIRLAQTHGAPIVIVRGTRIGDASLQAKAARLQQRVVKEGLNEDLREETVSFAREVQMVGHKQIDHLCRSLHALLHEFPETQIALEAGSHADDLIGFESMGWVLADLERQGLGYWHDVGRIHLREKFGLPAQGQWLDAYASRMLGVHLQDAADGELGMPPGAGAVDFKLVAEYVPKSCARVIEMEPRHGRAEILQSVQFLVDQGF